MMKRFERSKQIKRSNSFSWANPMRLSHGLATGFTGEVTPDDVIQRIMDISDNPEWEICCSHDSQHIGIVGVYVRGHNTLVANRDVASKVVDGERLFDGYAFEEDVCLYRSDYVVGDAYHNEHFVRDAKIEGIWVKEEFVGEEEGCFVTVELLVGLAEILGISYHIV